MKKNLFKEIAKYIIKEAQDNTSDCNYIVNYAEIEQRFGIQIKEFINGQITEALCKCKEIADVQEDTDGFDVVLYGDYSPNYQENEEE